MIRFTRNLRRSHEASASPRARGETLMLRRPFLASCAALLAALLAPAPSRAGGEDLVLIVNAKNGESPDSATAKKLFLGDTVFWKGNVPVHVVVRPAGSPPGDAFFRAIGVAPARFKRIWQEKELSGQGSAPETIDGAAGVIAKVAADAGGLGVALASEVPAGAGGVRVIPLH
jgi:hypothetical protein